MLVILAGSNDSTARELAGTWPDTRLLIPRDLSRRGWSHEIGPPAEREIATASGRAVISGAIVPVAMISAVYSRLPGVSDHELAEIRSEDKQYVAAEMNAFLLSWLSSLPCRVVNRPSPLGLTGPYLRPEAWTLLAARERIPVRSISRDSTGYKAHGTHWTQPVTVVGGRCFGDPDPAACQRAQALAKTAGVDLLTVAFDRSVPDAPFVGAEPWADVNVPGVGNAILNLLREPEATEPSRSA